MDSFRNENPPGQRPTPNNQLLSCAYCAWCQAELRRTSCQTPAVRSHLFALLRLLAVRTWWLSVTLLVQRKRQTWMILGSFVSVAAAAVSVFHWLRRKGIQPIIERIAGLFGIRGNKPTPRFRASGEHVASANELGIGLEGALMQIYAFAFLVNSLAHSAVQQQASGMELGLQGTLAPKLHVSSCEALKGCSKCVGIPRKFEGAL